jgi:hypothetical protein
VTVVAVQLALPIVQVCAAGVGSTFPAWSTARTSNVCEPAPRPAYCRGLVHVLQAVACWLSRRHSNRSSSIEVWSSLPSNSNVAVVWLLGSAGLLVIVVSGGVVSGGGGGVQVTVPES